jgi:hypothetical protein
VLGTPIPGRVCWDCKHLYFDPGERGYSEQTPGSDMSMSCQREYWEFEFGDETLASFRDKLQTAERCADYAFERRK